MSCLVFLLYFLNSVTASILSQLGWPLDQQVEVTCPDNNYYTQCFDNCVSGKYNQTVQDLNEKCFPYLPPGESIMLTRHMRYGEDSGKCSIKTRKTQLRVKDFAWAWFIDFSDKPDLSRPDRIRSAYIDVINRWASNDRFTGMDIYIHESDRPVLDTDYDYQKRSYFVNGYRQSFMWHTVHLENPTAYLAKYKGWSNLMEPRVKDTFNGDTATILNVTELVLDWARTRKTTPEAIVVRTVLFDDFLPLLTEYDTYYAADINLALLVREEAWVVGEYTCELLESCGECNNALNCTWCMDASLRGLCTDSCQSPWIVDETKCSTLDQLKHRRH